MIIPKEEHNMEEFSVTLRCATEDDAQLLIDYLKTVTDETPFLSKCADEVTLTLEQEKAFINSVNESPKSIMLLGFIKKSHVGNCSYTVAEQSRACHRATVGIALYEKFTELGIGTMMMKRLIELAEENGIEQLELKVNADNLPAFKVYQRLGFKICGRYPNHDKYKDGTYADCLLMVKTLHPVKEG